jgi:Zn-dependent peptidase ImmA (M78 family)
MLVILDAIRTLLNTKQKDMETLQDYTKRFRIAREVLESHIGGPIILTKIVKTIQGYMDLPTQDIE